MTGESPALPTDQEEPPVDRSTRVVETHTATLFFLGDRVYKLKKAIDLGFLDHRTREARRRACEQEVALNRRLAPDVYDGVLDISGADGRPLDHLVSMRRMPDERRLSRCIERGEDLDGPLRAIARSVATLHEASEAEEHHDRNATVEAVRRRWLDGFDQLAPLADLIPEPGRLQRSESLVREYLVGRRALFENRIERGWIRDGHGDLQAEDVFVLADGPRILDCIEFGDDYRWGDVLADVGFLAMDLERLGRPDLAIQFLDWHGQFTGDVWPASLAHHYVAYRAHVRAKVGIIAHVQRDEPVGTGVGELIDLSLAHLRSAQVRLIVIGGLPGTGKSTVAQGVADRLDAVVLRTDEIRRRDGSPTSYSAAAVASTYRELLDEAARLVGLGESVILDATWNDAARRDEARAVGVATSSAVTELQCTLPQAVAAERIRQRQSVGTDPSEATEAVAEAMAERFDEWPGSTAVSTDAAPETVASAAVEAILAR